MINIPLDEDDRVDVMKAKRAFKKNAINSPLYMASNGSGVLLLILGDGTPAVPVKNFVEAVITLSKYWTISEMPLWCWSFVINH